MATTSRSLQTSPVTQHRQVTAVKGATATGPAAAPIDPAVDRMCKRPQQRQLNSSRVMENTPVYGLPTSDWSTKVVDTAPAVLQHVGGLYHVSGGSTVVPPATRSRGHSFEPPRSRDPHRLTYYTTSTVRSRSGTPRPANRQGAVYSAAPVSYKYAPLAGVAITNAIQHEPVKQAASNYFGTVATPARQRVQPVQHHPPRQVPQLALHAPAVAPPRSFVPPQQSKDVQTSNPPSLTSTQNKVGVPSGASSTSAHIMQYMQHELPNQVAEKVEKVLSRQATCGQVPAQAQVTSQQLPSGADMVSTIQFSERTIQESRDKRDAETQKRDAETQRLELAECKVENQELREKLKQEVQNKDRDNLRFQSEIDNLSRALQNKDEEVRKNHKAARDLEGEVRILRSNKELVENSKHELNKAQEEVLLAKKQVEEKDKELRDLRWKFQSKESQASSQLALAQQDIHELQAEIQREQAKSTLACMTPGEMIRRQQESAVLKINADAVVRLEAELCDTKGELDKAMRTIASMASQRRKDEAGEELHEF